MWKHVEAGDFASSSTLLFTEWDFRIWISDNSINETLGYWDYACIKISSHYKNSVFAIRSCDP